MNLKKIERWLKDFWDKYWGIIMALIVGLIVGLIVMPRMFR